MLIIYIYSKCTKLLPLPNVLGINDGSSKGQITIIRLISFDFVYTFALKANIIDFVLFFF